MKKILQFIKDLFVQSFFKNGKPHMPYVYLWFLLILVAIGIVLRYFNFKHIDNQLIGILSACVATWITLLNAKDILKK